MSRDWKTEQAENEFNKIMEEQIQEFVNSSVDEDYVRHLWYEMMNDPFHADPDMDYHFDITIDERLCNLA